MADRTRSEAETYVFTDIETDGHIPGENSMLSLGSAAFDGNGVAIASFEINFEALPGATANLETMEWWRTQPEAWAATRDNSVKTKAPTERSSYFPNT